MTKIVTDEKSALRHFAFLRHESQEVMAALFLNVRLEVIEVKVIFRGTLEGALASPREILKAALETNAARIIVAHNHPSGSCDPSAEDRDFTARLVTSCELMGIPMLDHLILGAGEKYYSFARAEMKISRPSAKHGRRQFITNRYSRAPGRLRNQANS